MEDSKQTPLLSPHQLQQDLPITMVQREFIAKSRDTIKQILNGTDSRLLLIAGPCSIHDRTAALEYAIRLKELALEVSDTFFIVMRFYTEKSRSSLGWKGMLYDPDLNGTDNISAGLIETRRLLLELATMEVPAAAELLDPLSAPYYSSLLSWGCIGARTAESQTHRLMASGLCLPIGFKNNTSGSLESAINGALVASQPHTFIGLTESGQVGILHTKGNSESHITLRGGDSSSNYDEHSIKQALEGLKRVNLPLRVIIDCSHDNSRRNPANQPLVFKSVLKQFLDGNTHIRGLALESHLNAGNQPLRPGLLHYAVSITDPCLDWDTTAQLVREGCRTLRQGQFSPCAVGMV